MWVIRGSLVTSLVMLLLISHLESKPQEGTTNATTTTEQPPPADDEGVTKLPNILPTGELTNIPGGQQQQQQNSTDSGEPCVAYDGLPAVCGYHGYKYMWCYTTHNGYWGKCTTTEDPITSYKMEDSVGLVGDSYVSRFSHIPRGWEKITKWEDPKNAREFVQNDMVNKILSDPARPKKLWVVIMLGGNDIPYQTDSKIVQDLYSIAVGFRKHGLTPFICGQNPITHPRTMTPAEYKTRIMNINQALKDTFISKGWEYDVVVSVPDIEIGEDGIHPTDKGFKDLKQAIITHIATYFQKKIISWSCN